VNQYDRLRQEGCILYEHASEQKNPFADAPFKEMQQKRMFY